MYDRAMSGTARSQPTREHGIRSLFDVNWWRGSGPQGLSVSVSNSSVGLTSEVQCHRFGSPDPVRARRRRSGNQVVEVAGVGRRLSCWGGFTTPRSCSSPSLTSPLGMGTIWVSG
jgi:hypothetical protein